jgi:hypothetical protein
MIPKSTFQMKPIKNERKSVTQISPNANPKKRYLCIPFFGDPKRSLYLQKYIPKLFCNLYTKLRNPEADTVQRKSP